MGIAPVYLRSSLRAGQLKHIVAVQTDTESRTTDGGFKQLWTTAATRRAHVSPLTGGEALKAGAISAGATHKVVMRYYEGLSPKMRLVHIESDGQNGVVNNATNATPIVARCASAAGVFTVGDYVWIRDVGGNTATNGVWKVTTATPITGTIVDLTLKDERTSNSVGDGAYTSGGTWERLYGLKLLNILHIGDLDSERGTYEVICAQEVL